LLAALAAGASAWADPCQVTAPGGSGSVSLPPQGCAYLSPDDVHAIIDGLPPGTEIELGAIHIDFICRKQQPDPTPDTCGTPGGPLGGEVEQFNSAAVFSVHGTGGLAGFNRNVTIPNVFCVTATQPRPGGSPSSFNTAMLNLQGQITGDPDFDLLRITAGNGNGLPSPGHTTLTQGPGGLWTVDSFFDITYRIDFIGAPGGPLAGMSGSTTATIRMAAQAPPNTTTCSPAPDGQSCNDVTCNETPSGQTCEARCAHYNPENGFSRITACDCRFGNECHIVRGGSSGAGFRAGNPCEVADNGGGTVTLPPAGCEYLSPSDVHMILNGLPPGTTLELGAAHKGFFCHEQPGSTGGGGVCSVTIPPGLCEQPGGTLTGQLDCFNSTLELDIQGTGVMAAYSRTVALPLSTEIHTGPRTPGAPVQDFATNMFRQFGQITGDPDFDLLRIVAGSDFGLPSPGHTTLTQLPGGTWAVDSFFDITYRIDFVGAAGGPFAGMSGSTTGTIRMATGVPLSCSGVCPVGTNCKESRTVNADGTIDVCCDCVTLAPDCNPADVNCDGSVNGGDILAIRAPGTWNTATTARPDVNNDGQVNGGDILAVRAPGTWNTSTGPCTCTP
jgi:hypothetical protein